MPARQLRGPLDRDRIAQAFQGLDGPLPLACLLFWVTVILSRLLITGPRSEEMVDLSLRIAHAYKFVFCIRIDGL
jgi:hypothetical protein